MTSFSAILQVSSFNELLTDDVNIIVGKYVEQISKTDVDVSAERIDRFFSHEECLDQLNQQKEVTFTKERVSVKPFHDQKTLGCNFRFEKVSSLSS